MRLTTANSADPVRSKQALMIAESLLEEVALAGFTYCDPTSANADSAAGTAGCTANSSVMHNTFDTLRGRGGG